MTPTIYRLGYVKGGGNGYLRVAFGIGTGARTQLVKVDDAKKSVGDGLPVATATFSQHCRSAYWIYFLQ